jgi:hypothetical protein
MSWLRQSSSRQSFTRRTQELSGSNAADQKAVCDSFESHWMQIEEIIKARSEVRENIALQSVWWLIRLFLFVGLLSNFSASAFFTII